MRERLLDLSATRDNRRRTGDYAEIEESRCYEIMYNIAVSSTDTVWKFTRKMTSRTISTSKSLIPLGYLHPRGTSNERLTPIKFPTYRPPCVCTIRLWLSKSIRYVVTFNTHFNKSLQLACKSQRHGNLCYA